jgi:carbonic anhydrase/acetyltransferase-like protein (isoleucine patch superfamily)
MIKTPTTPVMPAVGESVFIAPTACVCGDVTLGDQCTVMHHVVIRGDVSAIRIGRRVNIQDATVIHTKTGVDLDIADDVGIGHRAIVHCKTVGPNCLIGMGAIILDDCEIGAGCLIGAGALIPPATQIPDNSVVIGAPGRVIRTTSEKDRQYIRFVVENYLRLNPLHAAGLYPNIAFRPH